MISCCLDEAAATSKRRNLTWSSSNELSSQSFIPNWKNSSSYKAPSIRWILKESCSRLTSTAFKSCAEPRRILFSFKALQSSSILLETKLEGFVPCSWKGFRGRVARYPKGTEPWGSISESWSETDKSNEGSLRKMQISITSLNFKNEDFLNNFINSKRAHHEHPFKMHKTMSKKRGKGTPLFISSSF